MDRAPRLWGVIWVIAGMATVTWRYSGTAWLIAYFCIYCVQIDRILMMDLLFDQHPSLSEFWFRGVLQFCTSTLTMTDSCFTACNCSEVQSLEGINILVARSNQTTCISCVIAFVFGLPWLEPTWATQMARRTRMQTIWRPLEQVKHAQDVQCSRGLKDFHITNCHQTSSACRFSVVHCSTAALQVSVLPR